MIEIRNLSKSFPVANGTLDALKNVNLTINTGDVYGIIGMSGAGKSTLVRTINMLERPTEGSVIIDGVDLKTLSNSQLREKRKKISMIFQSFNLLQQRNCLSNICFPLELDGMSKSKAKAKAKELLEIVGLSDKAKAYPSQLSGGQQQRIAIARALARDPDILLCDEATSALDPQTTNSILSLIKEINQKTGITVVVITHQMSVVESICSSVAILSDGQVAECGSVTDIFTNPKSDAAKKLIFRKDDSNELNIPLQEGERLIRVVFNGADSATTPLIAQMAIEKNILANIAYADTKTVNGKAYGTMLLGIRGGEQVVRDAIDYLSLSSNVSAKEV